ENLGPDVNSKYDDLVPVISPDGTTLYISRIYSPGNMGGVDDYSDIYRSKLENNRWSPAINIRNPLNNADPNSVCSVSPAGNFLLLMNDYSDGNAAVSGTVWLGNEWKKPIGLSIKNYYNKAAW
ncbi:MAG TPA: hypothetical protein PKN21_12865, partial [Bacteroidales bacterium]|nr:hypothetical protein [Bacteroidales bacterium]